MKALLTYEITEITQWWTDAVLEWPLKDIKYFEQPIGLAKHRTVPNLNWGNPIGSSSIDTVEM